MNVSLDQFSIHSRVEGSPAPIPTSATTLRLRPITKGTSSWRRFSSFTRSYYIPNINHGCGKQRGKEPNYLLCYPPQQRQGYFDHKHPLTGRCLHGRELFSLTSDIEMTFALAPFSTLQAMGRRLLKIKIHTSTFCSSLVLLLALCALLSSLFNFISFFLDLTPFPSISLPFPICTYYSRAHRAPST